MPCRIGKPNTICEVNVYKLVFRVPVSKNKRHSSALDISSWLFVSTHIQKNSKEPPVSLSFETIFHLASRLDTYQCSVFAKMWARLLMWFYHHLIIWLGTLFGSTLVCWDWNDWPCSRSENKTFAFSVHRFWYLLNDLN